jgi:hypothetical protein
MAATETLEKIAGLLPHPQREQFLLMVTQFKSVPDDDEYLQILNAIGFMTLIWKEIPNEIRSILEKSNPITDTCHTVGRQIRDAVVEAIPSYEDLKQISKRLEEHEVSLKRVLSDRTELQQVRKPRMVLVFISGAITGWLAILYFPSLLTWLNLQC